jgi:hypothetical protein
MVSTQNSPCNQNETMVGRIESFLLRSLYEKLNFTSPGANYELQIYVNFSVSIMKGPKFQSFECY